MVRTTDDELENASARPVAFEELAPNDAAIVETFAVPRYLSWFGELAMELLLVGQSARVAHLGCRTGYPDRELLARMPDTTLIGVDRSEAALELARLKAGGNPALTYVREAGLPTSLPERQFSHVLSLHPMGDRVGRAALFGEMRRLLYPGGQAVASLPLSSSFRELTDLLREFALKFDDAALSKALETAYAERLTVETLADELEAAGLYDVDFEVQHQVIGFDSGRALIEDPVTRFFIFPELASWLGVDSLEHAGRYLVEAVDKYWSEARLDVGVQLVAVSARR